MVTTAMNRSGRTSVRVDPRTLRSARISARVVSERCAADFSLVALFLFRVSCLRCPLIDLCGRRISHITAVVCRTGLQGLPVPEKFMILVVPAEAATDVGIVRDELHALEPLDLLETELRLIAESQRCTMAERQGGSIHVVGKHRQVVSHLFDRVRVIVDTPVRSVTE